MKPRRPKARPDRWPACNLMQLDGEQRLLWQFATSGSQTQQTAHLSLAPNQPLPEGARPRTWRSLFSKRLNLAWLPANRVFLRIATVPRCEPDELPAMLELQLEKVSPIPVNQIVWSFESLGPVESAEQIVVFVIAERAAVEAYLGHLETSGFQPDRLEFPLLHRVVTHPPAHDGIWLHLQPESGHMLCLAAWWFGGALRQLNLLQLPDSDQGPQQWVAMLHRLAWAAQFEGWLPADPAWFLVATPGQSATWEATLRTFAGPGLTLETAPSTAETALLAARRHSRGEACANLLPAEFASRYRLQTIDRLWMQGLASILALYLVGLAAYFGVNRYHTFKNSQLLTRISQVAPGYTNALNLRERLQILREQAGLKFAALESWRLVSELLPAEVTLDAFNFQGGERLHLAGTVSATNQGQVSEFVAQLRKLRIDNQLLFEEGGVEPPRLSQRGDQCHWDFNAKLRTTWIE